jgi:hypothetical protein
LFAGLVVVDLPPRGVLIVERIEQKIAQTTLEQGCQIFLFKIPKWENIYTKLTTQHIPNGGKMNLKLPKWPLNMPKFSFPRPTKINQNWDIWSENILSGNPALKGYANRTKR